MPTHGTRNSQAQLHFTVDSGTESHDNNKHATKAEHEYMHTKSHTCSTVTTAYTV